ncbi:MAG: hypothetical protein AAGI48_14290 [Verrucomicrobiota bacterium]
MSRTQDKQLDDIVRRFSNRVATPPKRELANETENEANRSVGIKPLMLMLLLLLALAILGLIIAF